MRILKYILWAIVIAAVLAVTAVGGAYYFVKNDLPTMEEIYDVRLKQPVQVLSADGQLIAVYGDEKREVITYTQIPTDLQSAILSAEDQTFFEHNGVEWRGLARAVLHLVRTGERGIGGSTITMQAARNMFLTRDRTYTRKVAEIFLAVKMELAMSKEEILALYVNRVFLGHRSYGFMAASKTYYDMPLSDLDLAQTAMLVGLLKGPSVLNPIDNPQRGMDRRNYVLRRMRDEGYISSTEYQLERVKPITAAIHSVQLDYSVPYVGEMVRARVQQLVGDQWASVGYKVYTTIDIARQKSADESVRRNIMEYELRHGYERLNLSLRPSAPETLERLRELRFGPLTAGVVVDVNDQYAVVQRDTGAFLQIQKEDMSWARERVDVDTLGPAVTSASQVLAVNDVIMLDGDKFVPYPRVRSALVDVDPTTGHVRAVAGGYSFDQAQFNHATQIERQPGSAIKPFLYSAAFELGYTGDTIINDAPFSIKRAGGQDWRPKNYNGRYFGLTPLSEALVQSRNVVAVKLLREMNMQYVMDFMQAVGFNPQQLQRNLSLALGNAALSPMDLAQAYTTLANGGYYIPLQFISRIEDTRGRVVFEAPLIVRCDAACELEQATNSPLDQERRTEVTPAIQAQRVIAKESVVLVRSLMEQVVRRGTAASAGRVIGQQSGFGGKTGTTNDQVDAWFAGISNDTVAITWIGHDTQTTLGKGEVGGVAALPAWLNHITTVENIQPQTTTSVVVTAKPVSTPEVVVVKPIRATKPKPVTVVRPKPVTRTIVRPAARLPTISQDQELF